MLLNQNNISFELKNEYEFFYFFYIFCNFNTLGIVKYISDSFEINLCPTQRKSVSMENDINLIEESFHFSAQLILLWHMEQLLLVKGYTHA